MNEELNKQIAQAPERAPMLDVIVVSYHHAHFMEALFASLPSVRYPKNRWRLHVVANDDADGTWEEAERLKERYENQLPEVLIHRPKANLGFSGGNNLVMSWSMQHEGAYVYLLNPDTTVEPDAFTEAVRVAEQDPGIGAVQSLLIYGQAPEKINSAGNQLHFLGFGYTGMDGRGIEEAPKEVQSISYPSGAGVLFPLRILKQVGLLDEFLFAYHEDLDLGWRIWLAGYRCVLAPKSRINHFYEFSRSIGKWEFMERNRWVVLLSNYRWMSIIVLMPSLLATEAAMWVFAIKGGWFRKKWNATMWILKPNTWKHIMKSRLHNKSVRRVPDALIFERMTWRIDHQGTGKGLEEQVANLFWKALYVSSRLLIRW